MANDWATSAAAQGSKIGIDLHLELTGPGGLRAGLMDALREAVRTGRLAPGTRLPSSRSLAADLGVSGAGHHVCDHGFRSTIATETDRGGLRWPTARTHGGKFGDLPSRAAGT